MSCQLAMITKPFKTRVSAIYIIGNLRASYKTRKEQPKATSETVKTNDA